MIARSFRALDTDVLVETDDAEVEGAVATLTGNYPPARAEPSLHYRLEGATGVLQRDDETLRRGAPSIDLALIADTDLQDQVVRRAGESFLVHAAALAGRDGALLLVAQSGGGKTTMTRALLARGARYLTDEASAIDTEHRVRGLPRTFTLEGPDPEGLAPPEAIGRIGTFRYRPVGGGVSMYRVVLTSPERIVHEPVPVAAIVVLQYAPEEPSGLTRMPSAAALQTMWGQNRRADAAGLEIAIALAGRFAVHRLVTHSIDQGCADLAKIWSL